MKTNILFIILLFVSPLLFSQKNQTGFTVYAENNVTWFEEPGINDYAGNHPKDSQGKELNGDPDGKYSLVKLKSLENSVFGIDEQAFLRLKYRPRVVVVVKASNGSVVSVAFAFSNLSDPDSIDAQKLSKLSAGIKKDIRYENLVFGGKKAVSGYMLQIIPLFRNR